MSSTNGEGGMLSNLKFNTVGREEVATEVLTPQIEPAAKMRNIILGIVAVVALAGMIYAGFRETGKSLFAPPKDSRQLQVPDHSMSN